MTLALKDPSEHPWTLLPCQALSTRTCPSSMPALSHSVLPKPYEEGNILTVVFHFIDEVGLAVVPRCLVKHQSRGCCGGFFFFFFFLDMITIE